MIYNIVENKVERLFQIIVFAGKLDLVFIIIILISSKFAIMDIQLIYLLPVIPAIIHFSH